MSPRPVSNESTNSATRVPTPGRFYDIQARQGGLLTTVGKAYGLGSGAERLRRAQEVNAHPLNRKFWKAPRNAFERKHFPHGIISFLKEFTCGAEQRRARSDEARCYARIWLPVEQRVVHPELGPGLTWPGLGPGLLPELCAEDVLDAGCWVDGEPPKVRLHGPDDRVLMSPASPPGRWICELRPLFPHPLHPGIFVAFGSGTGVLVSENHILTAAHNLHRALKVGEAWFPMRASAVLVIPGRPGPLNPAPPDILPPGVFSGVDFLPFEAFVVQGAKAIQVAPEWVRALREGKPKLASNARFDYGLLSLSKARACKRNPPRAARRPKDFWGGAGSGVLIGPLRKGFRLSTLEDDGLLTVAGYPGDKPCTQWKSPAKMKGLHLPGGPHHNLLQYESDTAQGMSGGPVWGRLRRGGRRGKESVRVLLGVHSGTVPDWSNVQVAAYLTPFVWRRLQRWMSKS